MKKTFIAAWLFLWAINAFAATPLKTVIEIYTTVSQGAHSIEETAQIAQKEGINALVFTDRDILKWEYGLHPLQNILKKSLQQESILSFGPDKYLAEIDKAQKNHPQLLLIPGTESAPFYSWQGAPWAHHFGMYDWDKHLLAIGMDKKEDYQDLPVIGNTKALRTKYNIYRMWPLAAIVVLLLFILLRCYSYTDTHGRPLCKPTHYHLILLFLSIIFAVNNYPFRDLSFDQYNKKNERQARQNYIDYVNRHNGLTFWAHPEASNTGFYNGIYFNTQPHQDELLFYHNYTGYCILYDGYELTGKPGGLWDDMLQDFCRGRRATPVWAIGGSSIERNDYRAAFKDLHNGVFCKNNRQDFMRALREGKMYIARGANSLAFTLTEFSLENNTLKIKGKSSTGKNLTITLIKYGKIIDSYEIASDFSLEIPVVKSAGKSYYRIEIRGEGLHVITNPVFTK